MNINNSELNSFEKKVKDTIEKHKLANKKEKIVVAVSGGKDSTTVLYLLNKFGYNVEALIIDLLIGDWSKENLDNIKGFCKEQGIKLHVANMRDIFGSSICYIRSSVQSKASFTNCAICGVIKRWLLNKEGREIGAKKLATGHNLDDEAENIFMNICSGNPKLGLGLGPKSAKLENMKFVQRIKPLYLCSNKEIREYSEAMNFPVLYKPCPCSTDSYRKHIRDALESMEKKNPKIKLELVEGFLKVLPNLRKAYKNESKPVFCTKCGEPSRNETCKSCQFIGMVKTSK